LLLLALKFLLLPLHFFVSALEFLLLPLHFFMSTLEFLLLPLCITKLLLALHFLHLLLQQILLTLDLRIDASLVLLLGSKHRFRALIRDVRISTGSQGGRRRKARDRTKNDQDFLHSDFPPRKNA
jgi:hypothetical protein